MAQQSLVPQHPKVQRITPQELSALKQSSGDKIFTALQDISHKADYRFRTSDGRRFCCFTDGLIIAGMLELHNGLMTAADRRRVELLAGAILEDARTDGDCLEEWARPMIFHDDRSLKQAWAALHRLHRVRLSSSQGEDLFCGEEYESTRS